MSKRKNKYWFQLLRMQAKRIKRERGIKHSEALEVVAEKYGYMDWSHARSILGYENALDYQDAEFSSRMVVAKWSELAK